MIIIIDAYNYIKSISGLQFVDEKSVQAWIETFKKYAVMRKNQIILVFDAGPGYYPSTHKHGGVIVMYAGQQQLADDVIKTWLRANMGADALLISSDRDVRYCADECEIPSVASYDFYKIFNYVINQQYRFQEKISHAINKSKDSSASSEIDQIMEEGSRGLVASKVNEHSYALGMPMPKGGKKIAKIDKKLMRKVNKI